MKGKSNLWKIITACLVMFVCVVMCGISSEAANTSFGQATKIELGTAVTDNLVTSSDVNYYKFVLEKDGYISVDFSHQYLNSSLNCWKLSVYDSQQVVLAEQLYQGTWEGVVSSETIGLEAGTYYICVNNLITHYDEEYTLKVNYTETDDWETEFNNSLSTADVVTEGSITNASLAHYDDVDYYKFFVEEDGILDFEWSHDYIDAYDPVRITVFDGDGTQMATWVVGEKTAKTFISPKMGLGEGNYYIAIDLIASLKDVKYGLKVNFAEANDWETENNGTYATADVITVNKSINGSSMYSQDADFYKVVLTESGYITLDFTHEEVAEDVTMPPWIVYLYDYSKNQLMKFEYENKALEVQKTPKVGLDAGTYYVKLVPQPSFFGDMGYEPYELKTSFVKEEGWETEYNNIMDKADDLDVKEGIRGTLSDLNDVDYYSFTLEESQKWLFAFGHDYVKALPNGTYWSAVVYDADGEVVFKQDYRGKEKVTEYSLITLAVGTYYVKVLPYSSYVDIDPAVTYHVGFQEIGWVEADGTWYYIDETGKKVTGWNQIGSTWYYMEENGKMVTGWKAVGGTWYYFSDSGAMVTGWQSIGGTWYYFHGSGAMATGWLSVGGTWYYFHGSGAMATGWLAVGGTWYYFHGSGAMATGWLAVSGTWYYFHGSGAMATGWQVIGGTWYYFYSSGAMAANTVIDGCYLNASGAWV